MSYVEALNVFDNNGRVIDPVIDKCLGACVGVFIGDMCGAPLEKLGRTPSASDVARAMQMNSQPTDDSELTMSLLLGLVESVRHEVDGAFSIERVAREYAVWARSEPIDMGISTGSSIGVVMQATPLFMKHCEEIGFATAMNNGARFEARLAGAGQSNGQLMRTVPIALFARHMDAAAIAQLCKLDCALSHITPQCADSSTAYCIALVALLQSPPATPSEAFARAKEWVDANACPDVRSWLNDIVERKSMKTAGGHVRVALCMALSQLVLGTTFESAMMTTIGCGGDTDTNAAIVGGLLGARDGFNALPQHLKERLFACRWPVKQRPQRYHPRELLALVPEVATRAPAQLHVASSSTALLASMAAPLAFKSL